jgi:hypothetical protein
VIGRFFYADPASNKLDLLRPCGKEMLQRQIVQVLMAFRLHRLLTHAYRVGFVPERIKMVQ